MTAPDLNLKKSVQRLYQLTACSRWLFVSICWLSLGAFGLWGLHHEIALWQEHLTWAALRYGLTYNLLPAFCLFFCLGITAAVSVWQGQRLLLGLSRQERQRLERQVKRIYASGPRHPLWKWVFKDF